MKKFFIYLCFLSVILLLQAKNTTSTATNTWQKSTSYKQLVRSAAFNFAIFSDNEGDAPSSKKPFQHMVKWMEKDNDAFVIGLGDHVKAVGKAEFITFLHKNIWWHSHFYPCAADGENQYYGKGQADWGAGGAFFKEVELQNNPNVQIRYNGVEYYAKIPVNGWTIHLVQLHYPDQPPEDTIAFNSESKAYVTSLISQIDKREHDIIIVCAHSRYGFWIDQLLLEQKKIIMEKCDLVLSATTHFFSRKVVPGYEDHGALVINTGSITHPIGYVPPGYVQVSVYDNPPALVVQYLDAGKTKPHLQKVDYAFVKNLGGKVEELKIKN